MNAALNEILSDPVLQSLVLDLRVNLGGDDRLGLAFASRFTQISRIVELIGPLTMSAGETFTQALMGRSPHVLRVGEATQGLSGSVLQRHLPNGWQFGLPNTILFTFTELILME
ncbi:MAG: hypothetical protein ACR2JB_28150 [Bryobacteraceae bacterium]